MEDATEAPADDYCLLFTADRAHPQDFERQVRAWLADCTSLSDRLPTGVRAGTLQVPQFANDPEKRLAFIGDLLLGARWRRTDVPRLQRAARCEEMFGVVLSGIGGTSRTLDSVLSNLPCYIGAMQLDPENPIHRRFIYEATSPRFWWDIPPPELIGPFDDKSRVAA